MSEHKIGRLPQHRVSYLIALLLGLACFVALSEVSWRATLDKAHREFSLETASIKEAAARNIFAGNDVVGIVAAYIRANPDVSPDEFDSFTGDLLERYPYIESINYSVPKEHSDMPSFVSVYQNSRQKDYSAVSKAIYNRFEYKNTIDSAKMTKAIVPVVVSGVPETEKNVWLVKFFIWKNPRLVSGEDAMNGLMEGAVAVLISSRGLLGTFKSNSNLSITMHSNTDNLLGRQLLYSHKSEASKGFWKIDSLLERNIIQLPQYSVDVIVSRDIYFSELDYQLIFIGMLLGAGVLLLLFALNRAKEIQASELLNRNALIEKQVEEQTRELAAAKNDALQASRMKSSFLAVMSHEIRTPLNAITGMAELLSETKLSDEQKKYTEVFRKASDTLLALVNDILDLSKIESNQMVLENIVFDIVPLLDEAVAMYALKAAAKDIDIVCKISSELNRYRMGDPARLRQILLNLINNALKFTDSGEIVVDVRADSDDSSGNRVKFAVSDTGIGIPANKLASIFADFTQADSSMTRKYGGTGLGLTIAKCLVEMMDGDIRAESIENKSTTFLFNVVLKQQQKSHPVAQNLQNKSALVIDDHVSTPRVMTEMLESAGMRLALITGAAVISKLQGHALPSADIVFVDSALIFSEEAELLDRLLTVYKPSQVLVMIGAVNINQHIAWAQKKGLNHFLIKPVKRDELIASVEKMVLNQQASVTGSDIASANKNPANAISKHILLVEDNPDNRLLIHAYLKSTPHTIQDAENGQVAVELFKNGHYDLVLMDVQMPVMDGHDATRTIRQWERDQGLRHTPIISLTAHAIKEEIDKCLKAGCDFYLTKPVRKATLIQTIEGTVLGR